MSASRETIRERRRRELRQQRMYAILGVVAVVLLLVLVFVLPNLSGIFAPAQQVTTPDFRVYPNVNRNTTGDPNAPIEVVEFSDFKCPACLQFYEQTEQAFVEEFVETGLVRFTYRSMGDWLGPDAARAAEAAYCAADQGKFWDYKAMLFSNQASESTLLTDRRLQAFAEAIDLDMNAFNDCLTNGTYTVQVAQDRIEGQAFGVTGTPAFIVNGKRVPGAIDIAEMRTVIDAALAEIGVQP